MSLQTLFMPDNLTNYIQKNAVKESPSLRELRLHTASMPEARMQIAPEQGHIMAFLAKLIGAKRYLEVGVFTGYSMLWVVEAMGFGACAVGLDSNEDYTDIAKEYWTKADVEHQIELYHANALISLEQLSLQNATFDLAFIDADKEEYIEYYENILPLMRPHGLILVDNIFWQGKVYDIECTDDETIALRRFNTHVLQDERVEATMLPVGDGMMAILKL